MSNFSLTKFPLRKKLTLIAVLIVILVVAFFQYKKLFAPLPYELATAVLASITEVVSETGNVTTTGAVPIYSTTTGIIDEVYVANNDQVVKGDVLFKVVSTATKQEKETARSAYLAAKAAWETAKAAQLSLQATMFNEWDQYKELAESDTYEDNSGIPKYPERNLAEFHISQKEWLASEASYQKQQIIVDQAAAAMNSALQAFQSTQDSKITAVVAGEIKNLSITKGDLVTVNNPLITNSLAPALIIFNPDVEVVIKIEVGETEAIKIIKDKVATVTFDAIPKRIFSGKVSRVDSLAVPTTGVVKYGVYVVLDEKPENIKGGMTANVDIIVAKKDSVLTVPASAVKPFEGGKAVRVVGDNDEMIYVPVETGIRGNGKIEIVSGISAGTEVITALKNEKIERKSTFF